MRQFFSLVLASFVFGCSTTNSSGGNNPDPTQNTDGGAGDGSTSSGNNPTTEGDPDEPEDTPHALGSIQLSESHAPSGGGTSSPGVYVAFYPNTEALGKGCSEKLDGCEISLTPTCTGCADTETCTFDDACRPKCKRICTKTCDGDEECYFASANAAPQCRKRVTFDTGAIEFAGTTVPITLFPPYSFDSGELRGSPFLAGSEITAQGSGATGAGFEKWTEKFKATTLLRTQPAIDKIPLDKVYGNGALPVSWVAGSDKIEISIVGGKGAATCKASDASGSFNVPRTVLKKVLGEDSTFALSVTRRRTEVHKGHATKGSIPGTTIESDGWLELSTISSESTSFRGCETGESMCGSKCTITASDPDNCGGCGKACAGNDACSGGKCVGDASCDACIDNSLQTSCKPFLDACSNDSACNGLVNCLAPCTTDSCVQSCANQFSAGIDKYNAIHDCYCRPGTCGVSCQCQ